MKDLGPLAAQAYKGGDGSDGQHNWQKQVEYPGAMLVKSLEALSEWGLAMGASMVGKCRTVFGIVCQNVYILMRLVIIRRLLGFRAVFGANFHCDG